MVAEQNVGQPTKFWWGGSGPAGTTTTDLDVVENTLASELQKLGFVVVDHRALQGKLHPTPALFGAEPSDGAIKEFAVQSGAEIVFIGKALATDAGALMGTPMHSLQANLSLRVLNLDDAHILAAMTTTQTVANVAPLIGGDKALEKAAAAAVLDLVPKISEAWHPGPRKVRLLLSKLHDYKKARALANAIGKLPNVKALDQRSFKNQVCELEVLYDGSAQQLGDALADGMLAGIALEVDGASVNTIDAHVR